jgi:cytochrome c peroxidase/DNA-binding beta-propeller fold protein YncE
VSKSFFWLALALCLLLPWGEVLVGSAPDARPEPHRSPAGIAVLPGGRWAISANHTADSASLIDLAEGKVLAEQPCGRKPAAVACSADVRRAAVSNLWSGTLTLLEVRDGGLRPAGEVAVGHLPRGLAFAPDGSVYVAVAGGNEVAQVDWQARKVLRRWPAPVEPRCLALSRDGRFLAAGGGRSGRVRCWDTRTGKQLWERPILGAFNLHGLAFSPDDRALVTAHAHDREHAMSKVNIENSWALDSRLGRLPLAADGVADCCQVALDERGRAVADVCSTAFSPGGEWLAAAASGTQELLILRAASVPWEGGDPRDFLDGSLGLGDGKYRRVRLGGRPLAVQFAGNDRAVVANYLLDAVQVVEAKSGQIERTVPLGSPAQPGLARRGEATFYDARRSHHQWFSCHTCHTDGHTCGRNFDTLNDDSYGNPKLPPTLRGVARTAPYTWHGWQKELGAAVEKSLTETLFGPKPSAEDVRAVLVFLDTLDHPPNPHRRPDGSRTEAAERGKVLFHGKAHCARCHRGEDYTSAHTYDLKLPPDGSPFDDWNPPSLRGVCDRGPYLHDGAAESLDEVLRVHHTPQKLGGDELTPEERRDLVEFLRSL